MNYFTFDIRKVFVVFIFVTAPFVLYNMQRNSPETLLVLRPFVAIAATTQGAFTYLSSNVKQTTATYLNLINIKMENQQLKSKNQELLARQASFNELAMENERLNRLLGFERSHKMKLLAAAVIGNDLFTEHHTISINRGSNHGVAQNMAVITDQLVVGYVLRTSPAVSQVLLITDRYAVVDAMVQRSRARGLLEGYTAERCWLNYLQRSDDVKPQDIIVTSGMHSTFPKGFPIGIVESVDSADSQIEKTVVVKPLVNAPSLEEVFVILTANNVDFSPEPATTSQPPQEANP